jgi:hypothetical protein
LTSRLPQQLRQLGEVGGDARDECAMQDLAQWLEKLGMSEYAQRFAENGIDVSVLRHLTDQDLEKVGVLLGHRRKMLAAIAEVGGTAAAAPERKPQDIAERRQVTVMFSDLVGSTELAARMDPEDLREVISAYQRCVTVRRFGGFVAKYMGDGILIYFGYPQAHEDDAERAVRAGLELVAQVASVKSSVPLQARVGIARGKDRYAVASSRLRGWRRQGLGRPSYSDRIHIYCLAGSGGFLPARTSASHCFHSRVL